MDAAPRTQQEPGWLFYGADEIYSIPFSVLSLAGEIANGTQLLYILGVDGELKFHPFPGAAAPGLTVVDHANSAFLAFGTLYKSEPELIDDAALDQIRENGQVDFEIHSSDGHQTQEMLEFNDDGEYLDIMECLATLGYHGFDHCLSQVRADKSAHFWAVIYVRSDDVEQCSSGCSENDDDRSEDRDGECGKWSDFDADRDNGVGTPVVMRPRQKIVEILRLRPIPL